MQQVSIIFTLLKNSEKEGRNENFSYYKYDWWIVQSIYIIRESELNRRFYWEKISIKIVFFYVWTNTNSRQLIYFRSQNNWTLCLEGILFSSDKKVEKLFCVFSPTPFSYRGVMQIEYGKVNVPQIIDKRKIFNEFCDASTIHGLKYLGTRPLYEK